MTRLAISVEGGTEEEFIKKLLVPHLNKFNVWAYPILLGSARNRSKGGNVSLMRLIDEMVALCHNYDAVTSLVDFYGFKDKGNFTVNQLEKEIYEEIQKKFKNVDKFIYPYVQKHEFEGLLFSEVEDLIDTFNVTLGTKKEFRNIVQVFETPEDINDNPNTSPSKRICRLIPEYNKKVNGPIIAEKTGLNNIRNKCPRFNNWVERLESTGEQF